ncbi:hypothetical protein GCM10023186_10830 [Hymenobacter koreensis]|uniref:Uncharacterized protein n=1 Tax=Hymenobacter koreensis TaxID=1084523 RepID=A0ABP8IW58_9BACT
MTNPSYGSGAISLPLQALTKQAGELFSYTAAFFAPGRPQSMYLTVKPQPRFRISKWRTVMAFWFGAVPLPRV